MSKISALWLCLNEIEMLPLSVASVEPFVDEIMLVNNRSTDGTLEWMRDLESKNKKVRVIDMDSIFDERTETTSRNEALSHVKGDWVLALDADQVMSDGWLDAMRPYMGGKTECIGVRYVHCVGSWKYWHTQACGVPGFCWLMFKNTDRLRWRSAAEVCAWAGPYHHSSADRSCSPGSMKTCPDAAVWHGGFLKRNALLMSVYRANRGDHGHEPEVKAARIKELTDSKNPFLFCGPVCEIDSSLKPPSILIPHLNDYELEISGTGYIQRRKHVASGEYC